MDAKIEVMVTVDGKRQSYRFTVDNVYGTLLRSQDVGLEVLKAVTGGLRRMFGASVSLESSTTEAENDVDRLDLDEVIARIEAHGVKADRRRSLHNLRNDLRELESR